MSAYKVSIRIKSDDLTFKEDYLVYSPITISHEDKMLMQLVKQTMDKVKGELNNPDIIITAKLTW